MKIRIAQPLIDADVKKEVIKVLSSGKIIQGKKVEEFENKFAEFIGVKYAVAVSSGTAALQLALLAIGIKNGEEVITTPFSFIASSNAILLSGGKVVFADIDEATYNIHVAEIEKKITKNTKVLLPVHLYGYPCRMDEILNVARRNNLFVIEDACQAHGAEFMGKKVGGIGEMGCFSFYPTKNMFTGEGGMITTNSKKLAKQLKLMRNHGSHKQYFHNIVGYNYRMTDISACIGISQLKRLDKNNKLRIANAQYLTKKLKTVENMLQLPIIENGYKHVFHQYTIRIKQTSKFNRKDLIAFLDSHSIESRIYYPLPIHLQKAYKDLGHNENLPISEKVSKNVLSLPIHPSLTKNDLDKIAQTIIRFCNI